MSIKATNPGEANTILEGGKEVEIKIRAKAYKTLNEPILGFVMKDRLGQSVFGENTLITRNTAKPEAAKSGSEISAVFRLWLPMLPSGSNTLLASIANGSLTSNTQHHWIEDATVVHVTSSNVRHGLVGAFITHVNLNVNNA